LVHHWSISPTSNRRSVPASNIEELVYHFVLTHA